MARQTFCNTDSDGVKRVWDVERLWDLSKVLPVKEVPVDSIHALDEVTWFDYEPSQHPTCRRVTEHAKRIYEATFDFPVILSSAGWVMDGMHRVCKAYLLGLERIQVVQFDEDPEPDHVFRAAFKAANEENVLAAIASPK